MLPLVLFPPRGVEPSRQQPVNTASFPQFDQVLRGPCGKQTKNLENKIQKSRKNKKHSNKINQTVENVRGSFQNKTGSDYTGSMLVELAVS